MAKVIPIQANTEVLGFYHKQKSEFHFQGKTDNEFLMFLLDTAVRVISIVQHLAPVIEAVSDANADIHEDDIDDIDDAIDSDFSTNRSMDIDGLNREVADIIQLPAEPVAPPTPVVPPPSIPQTIAQQVTHTPPRPPANQIPAPVSQAQYSTQLATSSVSLSIADTPAAARPHSNPQTHSQPTASTSTISETTYNSYPAPPPEPETEIKPEAVIPEIVTIKDEVIEPMQIPAHSTSQLLPSDTINQLMSTLTSNEDNIGVSNLVTTAQPSSLPSNFLDKSNNPLSMLSLSNTTSNLSNLFPSDQMPGTSRDTELKSLMDNNKAGGSGQVSNPKYPITTEQLDSYTTAQELYSQKKLGKLRHHLKTCSFNRTHQSYLQHLWYLCLYDEYKQARGLVQITAAQRYRIRRNNPLPPSLSATKFSANKYFDEKTRSVLDDVFLKNQYPRHMECKEISRKTGLTLGQIKTYFKNKRSRSKASELIFPGQNYQFDHFDGDLKPEVDPGMTSLSDQDSNMTLDVGGVTSADGGLVTSPALQTLSNVNLDGLSLDMDLISQLIKSEPGDHFQPDN